MVPSLLFSKTAWTFLGLLAALGNALSRVAIVPFFIQPIFDQVIKAQDLSVLSRVLVLGAIIIMVGSALLFLQDFALSKAGLGVVGKWRLGLYQRLLLQNPGSLQGTSGGLSSRLLSDLREVEIYYQYGLGSLVAESITLLATLGVLLYTDAPATLVLLALILPVVLLIRLLGRHVEKQSGRSQESLEHLGSTLQEGFKHHSLIRSFLADGFMVRRVATASDHSLKMITRRNLLLSLQTPLAQLLIFVILGGLTALLLQRVTKGSMTTGELVAYLTLVALMSTPAQLLPRAYASLMQARGASKRLKELWLPIKDSSEQPRGLLTQRPSLELSDISFSYANETILNNLSAHLQGPSLIALTGESGSGKTTLLAILLRFLQPKGNIKISGQLLSQLSEKQLRSYLAYVPQGSDLISGTLKENLCLGREFSDPDLWGVLQAVQLSEVVKKLGGLDYALGEDGSGLSGGQMQRLALARALLSDPGILLLDEPTSNLDKDTEVALVDLLKTWSKERLIIAVAHRPALIQAADQVFMLEHGELKRVN